LAVLYDTPAIYCNMETGSCLIISHSLQNSIILVE